MTVGGVGGPLWSASAAVLGAVLMLSGAACEPAPGPRAGYAVASRAAASASGFVLRDERWRVLVRRALPPGQQHLVEATWCPHGPTTTVALLEAHGYAVWPGATESFYGCFGPGLPVRSTVYRFRNAVVVGDVEDRLLLGGPRQACHELSLRVQRAPGATPWWRWAPQASDSAACGRDPTPGKDAMARAIELLMCPFDRYGGYPTETAASLQRP